MNETREKVAFDVFLSHNSLDKPAVRALERILTERGLRVWFDEDQLIPGRPWQPLLEKGIKDSTTGAVLIGADGLGPWEDEEMRALLDQAVRDKKPVIPVLLPSAHEAPALPAFLANRIWVDLRKGIDKEGIDKLVWGITGRKSSSEQELAPPAGEEAGEIPRSTAGSQSDAQANAEESSATTPGSAQMIAVSLEIPEDPPGPSTVEAAPPRRIIVYISITALLVCALAYVMHLSVPAPRGLPGDYSFAPRRMSSGSMDELPTTDDPNALSCRKMAERCMLDAAAQKAKPERRALIAQAAAHLGLSHYYTGEHMKGYALLEGAHQLGATDHPAVQAIIQAGWPYGRDGNLIVDSNQTLLAGSIMDYNWIHIREGCTLTVVTQDPNQKAKVPLRRMYWPEETGDLPVTLAELERFPKRGPRSSDSPPALGAITVLGCRETCIIDGSIVYRNQDHGKLQRKTTLPTEPKITLVHDIEQHEGGKGGNGGTAYRDAEGGTGGEGKDGYGGGGGGGGAWNSEVDIAVTGRNAYGGGDGGAAGAIGKPGGMPAAHHRKKHPRPWPPPGYNEERRGRSGGGQGAFSYFDNLGNKYWAGGVGGHGGTRGRHGGAICIYARGDIHGSGIIDVHGEPGGEGDDGKIAERGLNSEEGQEKTTGAGGGGGSGGGGAGGSGGTVWFLCDRHVSDELFARTDREGVRGGPGGEAGASGGIGFDRHTDEVPGGLKKCAGMIGVPGCQGARGIVKLEPNG